MLYIVAQNWKISSKTSLLWSHSTIIQSTSFLDIMFVVCAENRDPKLFSSVAWTLWNRRNNLRLGKPSIPLEQLLNRARELTLGCLPGPISASAVPKQVAATWTPPPLHGYKINCNGAIFLNKKIKLVWGLLFKTIMEW